MFKKLERGITRSARLVLDVREWYATLFGPGTAAPVTLPDGTKVRAIVRPAGALTVTARPTDPRDPRWPFPGEVELVTVRTPVGLLAFFGRARSVGGGPLRRVPLQGTRCRLRVAGPGYQPVDLPNVPIPAAHEATATKVIELLPAPDYPFPPGPTLLLGGVVKPDGTGIPAAQVQATDAFGQPLDLKPAVTDELGQWVLVLDRETGGQPVASPVDLVFQVPGLAVPVRVRDVNFTDQRTNRLPQTSVRGVVLRRDGEPVTGAVVTVAPFEGETRTRLEGTWLFYAGLDQPLTGEQDVTIRVSVTGQQPVTVTRRLQLGKANEVPPITI